MAVRIETLCRMNAAKNPMPTLLPLIDPKLAIGPVSITRKEGRSKSEPVLHSALPRPPAGLGTRKVGHLAALWRSTISEPGEGSVAATKAWFSQVEHCSFNELSSAPDWSGVDRGASPLCDGSGPMLIPTRVMKEHFVPYTSGHSAIKMIRRRFARNWRNKGDQRQYRFHVFMARVSPRLEGGGGTLVTGGGVTDHDTRLKPRKLRFLERGGEMGARMRAFDWQSTPLGDPEGWPQVFEDPCEAPPRVQAADVLGMGSGANVGL